jgi:hypothetical protein
LNFRGIRKSDFAGFSPFNAKTACIEAVFKNGAAEKKVASAYASASISAASPFPLGDVDSGLSLPPKVRFLRYH